MQATVLTDGAGDTVLLPILRWLIGQLTEKPVEFQWADLRILPQPPRSLRDRILKSVQLYPCDILFVHRDAERDPADWRFDEISTANTAGVTHIGVVPVRMQEAWLLHNEVALRIAAGRPSGTNALGLPSIGQVEGVANPKKLLHEALLKASGARGRKAKRFNSAKAAHRLAELIDDWLPLREVPAFIRLERDTRDALGLVFRDSN